MYWDEWRMRKLDFHKLVSLCSFWVWLGSWNDELSVLTNETLMIKNSISTHFQQSTHSSRYKKPNQEPSMQAQVSMSINISYWWVVSLKLESFRLFLAESSSFYIWEIIWINLLNKVPSWLFVQEICLYFGKSTPLICHDVSNL